MAGGPAAGEPALELREAPGEVSLRVRVQPRASREEVAGAREGALVVRLKAPPVEGRANEALVRFLARLLAVPPSAVRLARGAAGRDKLLRVRGLAAADVQARLLTSRSPSGRGDRGEGSSR